MQSLVEVTTDYVVTQVLLALDDIRQADCRKDVKDILYANINSLSKDYSGKEKEDRERCAALISELVRLFLQASMDISMTEAKSELVVLQNAEFADIIEDVRLCIYETLEEDENDQDLVSWIMDYWNNPKPSTQNGSFNIEDAVNKAPKSAFNCFLGNTIDKKKANAIALMKELVEERSKYTDGQMRTKKNDILVSVLRNNYNTTIHSRPSKDTFSSLLAPCVGISCSGKNVNAYSNFEKKLNQNFRLLK